MTSVSSPYNSLIDAYFSVLHQAQHCSQSLIARQSWFQSRAYPQISLRVLEPMTFQACLFVGGGVDEAVKKVFLRTNLGFAATVSHLGYPFTVCLYGFEQNQDLSSLIPSGLQCDYGDSQSKGKFAVYAYRNLKIHDSDGKQEENDSVSLAVASGSDGDADISESDFDGAELADPVEDE